MQNLNYKINYDNYFKNIHMKYSHKFFMYLNYQFQLPVGIGSAGCSCSACTIRETN